MTDFGLIHGDALRIPLRDASVDALVTSPPYFALRSYRDEGEHYDGQIGSEDSTGAFLAALWAVMDESHRVLKPTGSAFINLGDSYAGSGGHNNAGVGGTGRGPSRYNQSRDVPVKSLRGLPWRFALGLTCPDTYRTDGVAGPQWTLRAELIWSKPNCVSGGVILYARLKGRVTTIKVHDLCRHYQPDDVELWNGRAWTQVTDWWPVDYDGTGLELELRSGERIGCTTEHRWPVVGRGNVHAADLRVGDVIETCELPDGDDPERVDEAIGWFVGAYLANGSRSETVIQIASHVKHVERAKRLAALASAYGERCNTYRTSDNGMTVNLTGRFLDAILATYVGGVDAYTKHLRPAVWERSNRFLAAVLDGYIEGDGHTPPDGRIAITFTGRNDALAADLRTLATRVGASLRLRRGSSFGFGRRWPTWTGTMYYDPARRHRSDGEVVVIRRSRARRFWDIAVADDPHLFALASGVLTHNSLPESVTDRVRRSHEQWFHLTRGPKYYAGVDEIREAHNDRAGPPSRMGNQAAMLARSDGVSREQSWAPGGVREYNPLGKLPGSVWTIPSEPLVVPDHIGVDHFACVDIETEILTTRGWLRHDQLAEGDTVAGYNLDVGRAEWTTCHGVHRYDYDAELVAVDKRNLSMRLTPNHRVVVQKAVGPHRLVGPVHVVPADQLNSCHSIPRSAEWLDFGDKSIGVDLAALLGWVAAEGWYTETGQVRLSQSVTANPNHVATLDQLVERCAASAPPADRAERKKYRLVLDIVKRTTHARQWRGRDVAMATWALPLGLSQQVRSWMPAKLLGWWAFDLPEDERRALLDAFIDGDGHRRPDGRIGVFQKHRHNLDVLQAVAVTLGYRTTLRRGSDKWCLYLTTGGRSITLRGTNGVHPGPMREHYHGTVWCPTTGTGTFVARRNGSVFITGNSFPQEWCRRLILGWTPNGICTACGEGRRPVVEKERTGVRIMKTDSTSIRGGAQTGGGYALAGGETWDRTEATITGYACACDVNLAPTRPSVVFDPFVGTGTVPMVARALGRFGVGLDLSRDYLRLARWRIADSRHGAKTINRTNRERQGGLF